ncbi:MAG: riboflavin biosynthesis protein RibF, partial [Coriobacteriales bacterium]|nr:riboflavin biosynthesis protein RibF [Coriobacteriales bacterium]
MIEQGDSEGAVEAGRSAASSVEALPAAAGAATAPLPATAATGADAAAAAPLPAVLAIGVFDGLHRGHRYLLDRTLADARERGLPAWVLTFNCDPDELFKPAEQLAKLSTNAERLARLEQSGVDGVWAVNFNAKLAALEPRAFLNNVVAGAFLPQAIHVGADFRFGASGSGSADELRRWGRAAGCAINAHQLLCNSGQPITATRIRNLLAGGDVQTAAELLQKPYRVCATVVAGRHVGTALGFPTANLAIDPALAKVADGVYAALAYLPDGRRCPAAVSVGVPATFGDLPATTEATLLDYPADAGDLYGEDIILAYYRYLRPMQAFAGVEELKAAIAHNVVQTRELFADGLP